MNRGSTSFREASDERSERAEVWIEISSANYDGSPQDEAVYIIVAIFKIHRSRIGSQ